MRPLVLAIETSTPIRELERFSAQVATCLGVFPDHALCVWWDMQVSMIHTYGGPTCTMRRPVVRYGGSDVTCVFRWIDKYVPDGPLGLVVLTDGYTYFPAAAPAYPVIWSLTTHHCPVHTIPFGDIIEGGTNEYSR